MTINVTLFKFNLMFDINLIKTELSSLVGWRANLDPSISLVDLNTSSSGLYYQSNHPLLTLGNLNAFCPEQPTYPNFDHAKTDYKVDDIVHHSSKLYIRLKTGTNVVITNTEFWKETNHFNEWLKTKTLDAIATTINDWFNQKFGLGTAKNLLNRDIPIIETEDFTGLAQNGKVTGLEFSTHRDLSIKTKVTGLSLRLEQSQTVNIKVFKSGKVGPVYNETLVYTTDKNTQWFTVDWTFDSQSNYYICYYDISGNYSNSVECEISEYCCNNKYFTLRGFETVSDFTIIEKDKCGFTGTNNYGLNLKVSVMCDYTDFIVEQKALFANLIHKGVGLALMRELAYNPNANVNRNERNIDPKTVLYEIDGSSEGDPKNNRSLKSMYDKEMKSISFDQSKISKVCLPCLSKGVNYRTI